MRQNNKSGFHSFDNVSGTLFFVCLFVCLFVCWLVGWSIGWFVCLFVFRSVNCYFDIEGMELLELC